MAQQLASPERPRTPPQVREESRKLAGALQRGETWWDPAWSRWRPDDAWTVPEPVPHTLAESARPVMKTED